MHTAAVMTMAVRKSTPCLLQRQYMFVFPMTARGRNHLASTREIFILVVNKWCVQDAEEARSCAVHARPSEKGSSPQTS